MALSQTVQFSQISSPTGIVTTSTFEDVGTEVSTLVAPESWRDHRFVEWRLNGARQEDLVLGTALNPVSFDILEAVVATAVYMPIDADVDGDRVPDWFEQRYFGTNLLGATSDSDGDGVTLLTESIRGTHPTVVDDVRPGGLSRR
ncbi:MAG: hypothetical protein AAF492_22000, partial [Verrucomicrobiota bacterium]